MSYREVGVELGTVRLVRMRCARLGLNEVFRLVRMSCLGWCDIWVG